MVNVVGCAEQSAVVNTTQMLYADKAFEHCKTHYTKYPPIKIAQQPVTYNSAYRIGSMIKRKLNLRKAVTHYKFNYVRMALSKASGFKNKAIALNEALNNIGINIAEKLYSFFKICLNFLLCIQTGGISLLFSMFIVNKIVLMISAFFGKIKKAFINHIKEKFVDERIVNITNSTLELFSKLGSLFISIIDFVKFKPPSLNGTFLDELMRLIQISETARSVAKMPQAISAAAKKVIEDAKAFNSVEKFKEVAKSTLDKTKQTLKEIFRSFLSIKGMIAMIKNVFYSIHKCIYNIIESHLDSKITI